jgi:hypothetical protein
MEYSDRGARAQSLKEEMFAHGLYSLEHLPEERETWELLQEHLCEAMESEFDLDDSGYGGSPRLDGQER